MAPAPDGSSKSNREANESARLEHLAASSQSEVRAEVAGNLNTPERVLVSLSGDEDEQVRYSVAVNPNTPDLTLQRLAGDPTTYVRAGVARNTATPGFVLERLAKDDSALVRMRVEENPSRLDPASHRPLSHLASMQGGANAVRNRTRAAQLTRTPVLPGFEHWHAIGMSEALRHFAQGTMNSYMQGGYALKRDGSVLKWATRTALVSDTQGEVYEQVRFPTRAVTVPGHVVALRGGRQGDSRGAVFVLTAEGDVWAWGEGFYAEAGIEGDNFEDPVRLDELSNVASLTTSDDGATRVALTADGTLWAWGSNFFGWLGDGTTTNRPGPVEVAGVSSVADVKIHAWGVVALGVDGSVWTWGRDPAADRAEDDAADIIPARVPGLPPIVKLGEGRAAIDAQGHVWTWASGAERVPDVTGAVDVVAGETRPDYGEQYSPGAEPGETFHALTATGEVWAWGANDQGQIGNGRTMRPHAPERLRELDGVVAIAARDGIRYALKTSGDVWAWGGVGAQWRSSAEGAEVNDVFGATPRIVALPSAEDVDGPVKWGSLEITALGSEELRQNLWDLREGRTMLMVCAAAGIEDEVRLMLDQGTNPNAQDDDGDTALFYAASRGNSSIVELLLRSGADPNLPPGSNGSPLVIAARVAVGGQPPEGRTRNDYRSAVLALLRGGADPQPMYDERIQVVRNTDQGLQLIQPQQLDRYLVFDDLALVVARAGGRFDSTGGQGAEARGYASIDQAVADQRAFQASSLLYPSTGQWGLHDAYSRDDVARWLRAGAPINGVTKVDYGDGREHWEVPLLTAFIDGRLEAASALIEFGADVDAPNAVVFPNGDVLNHTVLHMVATRSDNAAASRVIFAGADVNRQTNLGTTPLHFAAREDNYELVTMLLRAGADPQIRDFGSDGSGRDGERPFDQAGPVTADLLR